jgi:hypothetical protein
MTNPRSGSGLSETCKGELLKIWIGKKYGRTKPDTNKYIEKGLAQEEEGISLYSLAQSTFFKKNIEVFENEFIIGTPDLIHANIVRDIKCSWDIFTFFDVFRKPINKNYAYQLNGYWDLIPGCQGGKLVYTLVNTPLEILEQEKSKLRYRMGLIDPEANGVYNMAVQEIEKNGTFDDIPMKERWIEFEIAKMDMGQVYERVPTWREFLTNLG